MTYRVNFFDANDRRNSRVYDLTARNEVFALSAAFDRLYLDGVDTAGWSAPGRFIQVSVTPHEAAIETEQAVDPQALAAGNAPL